MPQPSGTTRLLLRRLSTVALAATLCVAALPAVDAAAVSGPAPAPQSWQLIPGMHELKTQLATITHRNAFAPKHRAGENVITSDGTTASLIPPPPTSSTRSTWLVNYDPGFTTASTGPQAQAAFQAAVDIWSRIVYSPVPIVVNASYANLGGNILGQAGARSAWQCGCLGDGVHAYPSALANAIYGSDLDPTNPDITATFNSSPVAPFYYGTDGAPTAGTVDFESVVLHELGHGLGFAGSMGIANGATTVTYAAHPMKWDSFLVDSVGTPMLSYLSGSTQLTTAMESPLYWSGANGISANGGTDPVMYAPASWEPGSSGGAHLNETTYPAGDANSLMTPAIGTQEAVHSPGPDAVAMFRDIGWDATLPTAAPTAPSPPATVTATRGDGRATVSWNASSANGSPVTQYLATALPGGATCSTTGALSCDVTGLTNGTSYTFTVAATNLIGTGLASGASNAVIPAGKPGTPAAPTGTPTDGGVTVSWTAPSNNGDPIVGYDVESSSDNGTTWSAGLPSALTSNATQATFSGLANGTSYVFRVAAINGPGTGLMSLPSTPVSPVFSPGAPTAVQLTRGNTTVDVS
ncbi:MAG: fibronectin type III domain-containing protein, partial [Frankiales bacterium]|nr:fibronectin type III domain-containing protein [Frankiales bacterium]